jgi:hypothetical protein
MFVGKLSIAAWASDPPAALFMDQMWTLARERSDV